MFTAGFDNEKYLKLQSQKIKERISLFGEKLYIEFGGKLFDDFHASRVLPGFAPDSKVRMLIEIKDEAEIVIAINSGDIEKNKVRGDLGITYDLDVLRLIDAFRGYGLPVDVALVFRYIHTQHVVAAGTCQIALCINKITGGKGIGDECGIRGRGRGGGGDAGRKAGRQLI